MTKRILSALDTPAPPAEDTLRTLVNQAVDIFTHCNVTDGTCCCGQEMDRHGLSYDDSHTPTDHGSYQADLWMRDALAALAAAPIQPAPQPDADEREAMVAVIREGCKGHGWLPNELPGDIADALLAAGWTRRREDE